MRIGINRPTGITWAIASTNGGAAFITDASALTNGRVADVTRVQWDTGVQSTSVTVTLTATLGKTISASNCALLMANISTSLPIGVSVQFSGKLGIGAVALGGNTTGSRTVAGPWGNSIIPCVFPAVQIDTLIITISNDKNGSMWATAGQLFDLGEVWVGEGADFDVANDISFNAEGGTLQRQSHNNQQWPLMVQPYFSIPVNLTAMPVAVAVGPNPAQYDFQTVIAAMVTQSTTVIIPKYMVEGADPLTTGQPPPSITSSNIDAQMLARTFCLGCVDQAPKMTRDGQQYFISPFTFGENPP